MRGKVNVDEKFPIHLHHPKNPSSDKSRFMVAYNITTKISWQIADAWLRWQREENIPEIMGTGLFDSYNIYRLIEHEDPEGPTYIIQYFTSSEKKYKTYIEEFASDLRRKSFDKWGDQFISHRTIMERVQ